jgi:signal transduction histidine kinase
MSAPAGANRRILVVDDNRAIHEDFRKILCPAAASASLDAMEAALFGGEGKGAPASEPSATFEVDSAYQGLEGIERVRAAMREGRPYAVAFVDIRMPPGLDGVETTVRLWQEEPDLQVVLCSAYADYSWDEMVRRLGSSQRLLILRKPFDTIEVRQMAHALAEKWDLLRRSHQQMEALSHAVRERTRELEDTNARLRHEMEDRARLETRLAQAQRLESLGRLAAGLAHEINNPLSVVIASVGLLRSECDAKLTGQQSLLDDTEEMKDVCSDAMLGAERIRRIVNDIRLFSHLDGQPRSRVDVHEALEHALGGVGGVNKAVKVVRDFHEVPAVWASLSGLEQVFLGLLLNAVQAVQDKSEPSVRVVTQAGEDGWVRVEVQDNGRGIAAEHLHRIFDPFFTTKPAGSGTGLGLSICYGIITGLGGDISVESQVGVGSTFRVLLPRAPEESTTAYSSI